VAFLGGPREATSTQDRLAGFNAALTDAAGIKVTTSFARKYSFDAGREEMQRLLGGGPPAQAYFCGDDVLSIGALSALQDAGFDLPGDVGVIGLNDMDLAAWANINLTTIHNPIRDIIRHSVDLIAGIVEEDSHTPKAHLFDCAVVERGTLRPLPKTAHG